MYELPFVVIAKLDHDDFKQDLEEVCLVIYLWVTSLKMAPIRGASL